MTAVASTADPLARQVATALEIQNSLYNFLQGIFQFDLWASFYKNSRSMRLAAPFLSLYLCHAHASPASSLQPRLAEQPVLGTLLLQQASAAATVM